MSALPTTDLLTAARAGDENAFAALVEPHRRDLHAHCYRMLGSLQDAEDALQDAFLRAWRGLGRFEGRASLRTWLHRIATNACLDLAKRRPARVLPIDYGPPADPHDGPGPPLTESVWVEPYPDEHLAYEQRESVELAFVAALQHLPASQRAVLILREVLGFSAREVADTLETSVPSVNSALQRARKAVDERLPAQSQQATVRALGDKRLEQLVTAYVDAWEAGDVDAVTALLAEDAALAMPPRATWFRGLDACRIFLAERALARRSRLVRAHANGQVAFATYLWDPDRECFEGHVLQVLTLRGHRIAEVTAFVEPALVAHFGLPATLR
ncbi:MAG TPA: sigma-70 family RNA polymerase sigma factor [Solirubrobacteraceae bacterium]|jgi:RNA polymerase sigma-70 factor (ECF subfamily)|nr:sigma-70 family RNA polymerase sigma factor [Solirubrobacteraceae bacterium]